MGEAIEGSALIVGEVIEGSPLIVGEVIEESPLTEGEAIEVARRSFIVIPAKDSMVFVKWVEPLGE